MGYDAGLLLGEFERAVASSVGGPRIAVAFSGGVDSSLMANICGRMGYDVTLLTVGLPGSHDLLYARKTGGLGFAHRTLEIAPGGLGAAMAAVRRTVDTDDLSWNENCVAFYYVSRLARSLGIREVVAANGIDELFCGYDAYRREFDRGPAALERLMDKKLENELAMMRAINSVASAEHGIRVRQPLLQSERFVRIARSVPLDEKITGADDVMRKHVIRRLAALCGVPPGSCQKRKKAMQYGTRIHGVMLKARRRDERGRRQQRQQ